MICFKTYTSKAAAILCAVFLTSACTQQTEENKSAIALTPSAMAAPDTAAHTPAVATAKAAPEDTAAVGQAPEKPVEATAEVTTTHPGPAPLPGAVLPNKRIIAFYGNPLSKRMGILGELPEDQMLAKLDKEVAAWAKADSLTPVQPALHLIVVTAQRDPGRGNKYRLRMNDKLIDDVLEMAKKRDALVFLDIQVGQSTLQEELPQLESYLKLPQVHLGIDPEFAMKAGGVPGRRIGSYDAADINYATQFLANLVKENNLPPKLLVVHRFTQRMVTNYQNIKLRPEVQVVMHMDGWGHHTLKRDTYRRYIQKEPVQFTGFKLFYKNDLKKSSRLMKPEEILALTPVPLYIQYQ